MGVMPELPDVTVDRERLAARVVGRRLEVRVFRPFVLRTVEPPLESVHGRVVGAVGRIGKRLVVSFEGDRHLVLHRMIAGRLRWRRANRTLERALTDPRPFSGIGNAWSDEILWAARLSPVALTSRWTARRQNAGRRLADRGLSRRMREDGPRTLEELEERRSS